MVNGNDEYLPAWSVLLIRPHVSGDETKIYKQPTPKIIRRASNLLFSGFYTAKSESMRNHLVFFHLSPLGELLVNTNSLIR